MLSFFVVVVNREAPRKSENIEYLRVWTNEDLFSLVKKSFLSITRVRLSTFMNVMITKVSILSYKRSNQL